MSMKTIVITTTTINIIHLDVYLQCRVNYNWNLFDDQITILISSLAGPSGVEKAHYGLV